MNTDAKTAEVTYKNQWSADYSGSVTIPSTVTYNGFTYSVTTIGYYAFQCCSDLTEIKVLANTPPTIYSNTFSSYTASLKVPSSAVDDYQSASYWSNFSNISALDGNISLTNGICTFCSDVDLDFTDVEGITAYIISGFSPSTGTLTLTPVTKVPAGEGLLIKGTNGDYEIPYAETDMVYSNLLTGVTEATNVSPTSGANTNFILANGTHGINFYTISAAGNLAAGKAYLSLPTEDIKSLSRGLTLKFMDDVTSIDEVENGNLKAVNSTDGKYFENGQIVIVKNGKKYNAAGAQVK